MKTTSRLFLFVLAMTLVITPLMDINRNVINAETNNPPPDAPTGLLTDLLPNPMAIENLRDPHFSWEVNDAYRGEKQTAYQIRVDTDPDKLLNGDPVYWDSGKVVSNQSSSVPYNGPELQPATRYYWTVRTWDIADQASEFSKPASFGTALKDEWTATPIWLDSDEHRSWKNYTLEADVTIESNAVGLMFRAVDSNRTYMWQFSAQKGGLAPHIKSGSWREIDVIDYDFETGKEYHVKIEAMGEEITTYVDGEEIDKRILSDYMHGAIGVRTGSSESGTIDNLKVTSAEGEILYNEDFSDGDGGIGCGSVEDGRLYVGRGVECLNVASDDMAFFRKDFVLSDKDIAHATLYVTGLSPKPAKQYVYKAYINGDFVGVGPIQGYDGQTFYNAYDVTGMLKRGEANTIGAIAYTREDKRFLAELHVKFGDGSQEVVQTDDSWEALNASDAIPDGGNVGTGYYYAPAEYINAHEYPFGFSEPGFDSRSWSGVVVKEKIDESELTGQPSQNLTEVRIFPEKVVDKGDGAYFIDFGHSVTGGIRIDIDSPTERELEIRLGEELVDSETVRYKMRTGNTYRETWKVKEGEQTLQHWGYRVFRYAEVHGLPEGLDNVDDIVSAVALRYPFDEDAAKFTSSNDTLNTVWEFSKNSIRDLNHDLYYDSTTRERTPYEADAYIQQLAHYALDKEYALARVSHEYLYDHETWPTEWKQFSILAAWQDYLYTGDQRSLEKYYEVLKNKALNEKMTENGLVKEPEAIVDWPANMRDGYQFTDYNTVLNAFNYKNMVDLANMAEVLNKPEDVEKYRELAKIQKEALNRELFDPNVNRFVDGVGVDHYAAHANFFPVALGAATEENAKLASEYIAERGMAASVYGAPFILESLFRNGQENTAIDLLTSHDTNSWMNMIRLGAGSTTEAWDPSQKPNMTFSHPWAASPAYIVPREMFGIVPILPAFEKFAVTPRPGYVKSGDITVPTIRGAIAVSFNQSETEFKLGVSIPANTTAVVSVPASSKWKVSVDGVPAHEIPEIEFIEETDGYVVYEVGAGRYQFVSQEERSPFPPNNVKVEPAKGVNGNTLTWEDHSEHEDGFKIERKTTSGDWEEIATVPENVTTYTDQNVEPEQRYHYRVIAYNAYGSSASGVVSIFTLDIHNVAYKKPVEASSEESGNEAEHIVDGDLNTRWAASGEDYPQTVIVDLEEVYPIYKVGLTPYQDRAYQYKVETSVDGEDYTVVVDRTSNTEGGPLLVDEFPPVEARYVKLTVTGTNSGGWASVREFRVYTPPIHVSDIKKRVADFAEEGAFKSDSAVRALTTHLTAVERYETQGSAEKVLKHMQGFKQLLDYQRENELISNRAYQSLKANADYLIKKWQ